MDTSLQPSAGLHADLIEKYRPKYSDSWAQEKAPAIIERVVQACATRDYAYLVGLRFPNEAAFAREVFTRSSGVALHKTQRESLQIIREFVGSEIVEAYHQEAARQYEERQIKQLEHQLSRREELQYIELMLAKQRAETPEVSAFAEKEIVEHAELG
jgi:hypothetical protein